MNNGYILLYRNMLSWDWHAKPEMMALWTTLLLMANYEDTVWRNMVIKRGQLVTTMRELSAQTGIKERTLSVSLSVIQSVGQIVLKRTNKYTLITICNYDSYQPNFDTMGKQIVTPHVTQNVTPHCTQNCTPNSLNNKKKEKNIKESTLSCTKEIAISLTQSKNEDVCSCLPDAKVNTNVNVKSSTPPPPSKPQKPTVSVEDRRRDFAETIKPYVATYGRDMCNDFYAYWTEMSTQGRKMRFEKERTWSLSRRLATWYGNDFGRKKDLPPEIQATLPSLFDNEATTDKKKVIEDKLKEITAKYNIKGDDGEMYCSESDARYHDHPLSVVLEVERARLEKELK